MATKGGPLARYGDALRNETFAGFVLILGAVVALIWANSPARDVYATMSEYVVGPEALGLNINIATWAADGLLALFFFTVGLELKHEFVVGALRDVRQALVPILAAVFGMIGPMSVYIVVQLIRGSGNFDGWAVPVATDIAFALAVLGLFGKGLPASLRTFLMTLAVVDDLLGILIIAIFFSSGLNFVMLGLSFLMIAVFGVLVQKRIMKWYLLWPVGILAWYFMFASGIHATISGVALGMMVPAIMNKDEHESLTEVLTEKFNTAVSGFVLPIFAFFAAGVNVVDNEGGFGATLADPVAQGIYLGLPVGKVIGIFGGTFIMVKFLKLKLGEGMRLADVFAVSFVAGIGFTVSLLIATLSFISYPADDPTGPNARLAVILGTAISLVFGAIALRIESTKRLKEAGIQATKKEK
ncbi:MAG: Na+/H+ antiporter NhaA [Actinomycetaceae bacterium]|nr:Na+/H+ antiporter NhaA [Actinomycetaceae bacterium]